MNKNHIIPLLLFASTLFLNILTQTNDTVTQKTDDGEQLIYFNFDGEKLLDIIDRLTAYKQINLLLPADQKNLAETTITFKVPHKIKISDAWEMTITLLDIAGFATIKRNQNLYKIESKTNISKSNAPFYINISTDVLPNSNTIIRYIYYFQNIFLKEPGISSSLKKIIGNMLPMQNADQNFELSEDYNSLLITAQSNVIKGIINLIQELDQNGFREAIEVIPIIHTNAEEIVSVIKLLVPPTKEADQFRFPPLFPEPTTDRKTYFSSSTRIVTIPPTNSVAIFGPPDSVQRVKDFIIKYLDKKVDAEKTVLHVKPLKYLKSEEFAQTLNELIQKQSSQSTGENKERVLSNDIIVVAEKPVEAAKATTERQMVAAAQDVGVKLEGVTKKEGPIVGGNNIIVACNQRDWTIINDLVDKLDHEQWQVAIEVLIVDMSVTTSDQLGVQLRRIHNEAQLHNFKWQLANIQKPLLNFTDTSGNVDTAKGIEADLLSTQYPGSTTAPKEFNIASAATAGSTIFSFKDGNGMAAILKLLRSFSDTKIISQPFIIARNNEKANIVQVEQRMVRGAVDNASVGGTTVINYEYMKAATAVTILPRISKLADNINLEIKVDANEFIGAEETRNRTVETNANVGHKEVLVLGGISRVDIDETITKTPILSSIPILGYLFKQQAEDRDQRYLMIFISPSRIPPVSTIEGKSLNKFTQNQIDNISQTLRQSDKTVGCPEAYTKKKENFQCLRDPITEFFFSPDVGNDMAENIESYAKRGVWTPDYGEQFKKTEGLEQYLKKKTRSVIKKSNNNKKDPLKNMLQNEANPIKLKT